MITRVGVGSEAESVGSFMSRIVVILLIVVALLIALGLILPAIFRARSDEEFRRCQNHLRQIGAFGLFHSTLPGEPLPAEAQSLFPPGTVVNRDLKPDQRLSWYVLVLSAIDQGQPEQNTKQKKPLQYADPMKDIDVTKPWDADVHQKLARTRLMFALCPAQLPDTGKDRPALTNYLGNGGIGADTPALSFEDAGAKAGVFRYDTPTPLELIVASDGLSNTISVVESAKDIWPWLQGGPATIRCLVNETPPYLGSGMPYSGCHRGRGNFAFADGSVRVLTNTMNSAVFRAQLTARGSEEVFDER